MCQAARWGIRRAEWAYTNRVEPGVFRRDRLSNSTTMQPQQRNMVSVPLSFTFLRRVLIFLVGHTRQRKYLITPTANQTVKR